MRRSGPSFSITRVVCSLAVQCLCPATCSEVTVSNVGAAIGYLDWSVPRFSSVCPGKCRASTLSQATVACFDMLPNSLHTNLPIIPRFSGQSLSFSNSFAVSLYAVSVFLFHLSTSTHQSPLLCSHVRNVIMQMQLLIEYVLRSDAILANCSMRL